MDLVQILKGISKGEFEPGNVIKSNGGIIFSILQESRIEITYPDGVKRRYKKVIPFDSQRSLIAISL
jgi:hypothetical protein